MEPLSPRRLRYARDRHPFKACCGICGIILAAEDAWMQIVTRDGVPENVEGIHPFFDNEQSDKLMLTDWLDNVRLLADGAPDFHHMQVQLSALATDCGNGFFQVTGTQGEVQAYHRDEFQSYTVPLHDECYQILQLYLGPGDIDLTALYDTFVSRSKDDDTCMTAATLGITSRYEAAELLRATRMSFRKGVEYLCISPMEVPELAKFYETLPLPRKRSSSGTDDTFVFPRTPFSDDFSCFAPEILLMIASQMDIKSLMR